MEEISSSSRTRPLPEARQLICYILSDSIAGVRIAARINRDRSHVYNARGKAADRIFLYRDTREKYNDILSKAGLK